MKALSPLTTEYRVLLLGTTIKYLALKGVTERTLAAAAVNCVDASHLPVEG